MIYFLVNNEQHYIDAKKHIEEACIKDVCFIIIKHRLSPEVVSNDGFSTWVINSPLTKRFGCFNIKSLIRTRNYIISGLQDISNEDTLFFYTEYELLNHYVCKSFYKLGCNTVLIEENGLGTYYLNKVDSSMFSKLSIPDFFRTVLPKFVFNCIDSVSFSFNGAIFHRLKDKYITSFIQYANISHTRNIKTSVVKCPKIYGTIEKAEKTDSLLFLSGDLYNFYMSVDEYIDFMESLFAKLNHQYKNIYFKFHPNEREPALRRRLISVLGNINVVEDPRPVELIVKTLPVNVIGSFMSSALVPLQRAGYKTEFYAHHWHSFSDFHILTLMYQALTELDDDAFQDKPRVSLKQYLEASCVS